MKPSFKLSITLTALCAFTLGWVLSQQQPQVKASPAIQGAYIKSVPLAGDDAVKLLRLNAYKFEFVLPDQHPCHAVLWMEYWNRSDLKPVLRYLWNLNPNPGSHTFMVKLPKDKNDEFVITDDEATTWGQAPALVVNGRCQTLDHEPIAFDKDITLIATAHNKNNDYMLDYKTPGFEKRNDHVTLLKLRFTKSDAMTPVWKNGHVVLQ